MSVITCPSGLSGRVRGFKAKEANILADKVQLKKGTTFDGILSGCWLETINPGPYPWLEPGAAADWGKTLVCDRFWTLLKIRAASYGDSYCFSDTCNNEDCEKKIEWELNLSDLPVKPLPDTSKEVLRAGKNEFETTLRDGKKCLYSLMTGTVEAAAAMAIRATPQRAIVAALGKRIISIEGLLPSDAAKLKYLDELDMPEVLQMVELFDENDGGVETLIGIECSACGNTQDVQLPLGRDFFLPKSKKKTATVEEI